MWPWYYIFTKRYTLTHALVGHHTYKALVLTQLQYSSKEIEGTLKLTLIPFLLETPFEDVPLYLGRKENAYGLVLVDYDGYVRWRLEIGK